LTEKIKRVATAHHGIWNYDRAQALVDGRVKVEGCEFDIELLRPEITFARRSPRHRLTFAKSRSAIR